MKYQMSIIQISNSKRENLIYILQKLCISPFCFSDCNRTYTGTGGKIFSPGWPGNYPRNAYCEMSISAPAGTYVTLYFNSFYIEPHSTCRYDYLEVN